MSVKAIPSFNDPSLDLKTSNLSPSSHAAAVAGGFGAGSSDPEESFADLFAASDGAKEGKKQRLRAKLAIGDRLSGIVIRVGKEFVFIDIGMKSEARMSLEELDPGTLGRPVQIGDQIEGRVILLDSKEGSIVLSRHIPKEMGQKVHVLMAFERQMPIEAVVTGVNKGGLDITLGTTRGFLPVSQIELRHCNNPAAYVGQTLRVLVTKYDEEDQNVVVSRRAVLELEQREKMEQIQTHLVPGKVFLGTVTSVRDYGAFVDIGGVEGFLHVSEMGYGHHLKPENFLKPGQQIEVVLLQAEEASDKNGKRKISLSMKALMQDPFVHWATQVQEGQKVSAKVVRLEAFGAFVELIPGVEGLIHISAMADRPIKHPREVLEVGQEVIATVIRIDLEQHRIGLSLTEEIRLARQAAIATLALGDPISVVVEKIEPFGLLVRIPGQAGGEDAAPKGVIKNSELPPSDRHEVKRRFPVGKEVRAVVKKIEPNGRVELSMKAAEEAEERASLAAYAPQTLASSSKATLGDLLKKKGLV